MSDSPKFEERRENSIMHSATSSNRVYEAIKKKIVSGIYLPGQQLRIADLAKDLAVSQTPVREALIQLSAEDLLTFAPYRGAVVKGLNRAEVREIFAIRIVLECAALEFAMPSLTPELLNEAEALLQAPSETGFDPLRLSETNWNFHMFIYRQSHMPRLCSMIDSLRSQIVRYLRLYYVTIQPQASVNKHLELLQACRGGNVQQAVALRRRNMSAVAELLARIVPE